MERTEAEFAPGLNVITGETGAGKSVLMGALELVLGGRADPAVVREGAREAEVEAVFDDAVVRRTITAQGRSRAWIDDESVTIAELREFAAGRVDVHGPRANQRLLEEPFQREALDASGGTASAFAAYAAQYAALKELVGRRTALAASAAGSVADETDMLRYQVDELEGAELTDDDETIAARHAAAAHAGEVVEGANAITEALGGDEGAAETLARLQPQFAALARHLPEAADWAAQAEELTLRIQELSRSVADVASRLDAGEEDLEALDARLTLVNRLKRKYAAGSVAELLATLARKRERLETLVGLDERLAGLDREIAAADRAVRDAGAELTRRRKAAAVTLGRKVTAELRALGFLQARFAVCIEPAEPEAHGCDRVVYLFGPNPGEPDRPLSDIASSGEIARVMLAIKVAGLQGCKVAGLQGCKVAGLQGCKVAGLQGATLVFDEIDANIGGEIGKVVGERLRKVADGRQVIAITHLPQSAVFGARHLVVTKTVSDGRTRTGISAVTGRARVAEIARMLGGENLTSVVRKHAEELLEISR